MCTEQLTENVMENVTDAFIPLALKERQADGRHVIVVVNEEVNCSMRSVRQLSTTSVNYPMIIHHHHHHNKHICTMCRLYYNHHLENL